MANKWIQLMDAQGTNNLFPTSHMDLLWTNASPTSNFNAQTFSVASMSNYSKYVFKVRYSTGTAWYQYVSAMQGENIIYVVTQDQSGSNYYTKVNARRVTINGNSLTFTTGSCVGNAGSGTGAMANIAIPEQIYGIK